MVRWVVALFGAQMLKLSYLRTGKLIKLVQKSETTHLYFCRDSLAFVHSDKPAERVQPVMVNAPKKQR